MFAHFEPPMRS